MKITKLEESGIAGALLGIGLSYGVTLQLTQNKDALHEWYEDIYQNKPIYLLRKKMEKRANKLAPLGGGHNEFLKFIHIHLLITAPDYWWGQMVQYSFVNDLSTSLMHSALDRNLEQTDFEGIISADGIDLLGYFRNLVINNQMDFDEYIGKIPRGFLYTRVLDTNYMALKNIIAQRKNHKLPQWKLFCDAVLEQVDYPEWLE